MVYHRVYRVGYTRVVYKEAYIPGWVYREAYIHQGGIYTPGRHGREAYIHQGGMVGRHIPRVVYLRVYTQGGVPQGGVPQGIPQGVP